MLLTQNFYSTSIEWLSHQDWFNEKLNNSNTKIWIVERDKQEIGQVRVEYINNKLLVDIFIDSLFRRNNYGIKALKLLIKQCHIIYPDIPLYAVIKNENHPSISLFHRAGFQEVASDENKQVSSFVYKNSSNTMETSNGI